MFRSAIFVSHSKQGIQYRLSMPLSTVANVNTERHITFCALANSKIRRMTAGYKLHQSPDDLIQDRCGFEANS